ncbi:MAG: hypothetical protein HDR50_03230 [Desulfovibrio sp.]|uniref:hypothetical protein n=1 Tax=Desulfovibrio sp. TaxID=885 RepID=UPI001A77CEA7|nr:hypothetical protein [Desulfovibrio sp.]MBD5416679.1 hypothetical protein [Desulfovibrio sp.]
MALMGLSFNALTLHAQARIFFASKFVPMPAKAREKFFKLRFVFFQIAFRVTSGLPKAAALMAAGITRAGGRNLATFPAAFFTFCDDTPEVDLKKSGGNSGGNKSRLCKRAYDFHRKPLILLVAGAGFEPTTFGL